MQSTINRWFRSPDFPGDEEKAAQARIMHVIGLYLLSTLAIAALVYVPFFAKHKLESWAVILTLFVFYLIARLFLFRGHLTTAGLLVVSPGWVLCAGLAVLGGGITSPMMYVIAALAFAIGLFFPPRVANIFLVINLLVGLGFALIQHDGVVLQYFTYPPIARWFFFALSLVFINRTIHLTVRKLENALALVYQQNDVRQQAEEALRASITKFETLIQVSPLAITLVDGDGKVQLWNPAAEQTFGWKIQEVIGQPDPLVQANKQNEQAFSASHVVHKNVVLANLETVRQRQDGSLVDVSISSAPIHAEDGMLSGRMAIFTDITERKRMEKTLLQRNQEMATLYETSLEINLISDLSVLLNAIVQRACTLLHISSGAMHLVNLEEGNMETVVVHQLPTYWVGVKISLSEGLAGQVVQTRKPFMVEDYQTWQGRLHVYQDSPARRSLGIPLQIHDQIIGVLVLIDLQPGTFTEEEVRLASLFAGQAAIAIENARLYTRVQQLAITDSLTGVFNRAFFDTELVRLETSRDFPMSIVVADLDNMKTTNDTLGHSAGDQLLKNTAHIIQSTFRTSDIIARIGGDEFAVLLPRTDAATVTHILARVREKLAEQNNLCPNLPVQLSLGAWTTEQGQLGEAFRMADQHMYADKAMRKAKDK